MARLIAGAAAGKPFLDPVKVARRRASRRDRRRRMGVGGLPFPERRHRRGLVLSIGVAQDNVLRVYGTEGWIEVKDFWFASGKQGGTGEIAIHRKDREPRDRHGRRSRAGSTPSRSTPRAMRSAPGGRSSTRRA